MVLSLNYNAIIWYWLHLSINDKQNYFAGYKWCTLPFDSDTITDASLHSHLDKLGMFTNVHRETSTQHQAGIFNSFPEAFWDIEYSCRSTTSWGKNLKLQ